MINTDKQKETNLLLKLADKIDNPELKIEYLLKLKDLITNEPSTSMSQPYTLQKIFQKFKDSSKQNITLQDLQKEIKDTKQELQKFKQKKKKQITNLEQILLQKHSSSSSFDKEIEQIDQGEASTKFINLIERITYQKWHVNIMITIQDSFKLQTIALIDSGAQMNCIQEGLIPTKYFEKTKQKLSTANGENLRVNFKITDVHICNEGICIKQSFILVKDLGIGIILGQPFLEIIKPFKVTNEGITTKLFQQKILFAFNEKPITKEINLLKTFSLFKEHSVKMIEAKENHLSNNKLENQLKDSQIKEKIDSLKNNMINNLCSYLPDAPWHKKRHMVSLPYEKNFTEQNIPTKTKPIQMNYVLMKYCEKYFQELLNKKLIEPSKSLWICTTFCVQKSVMNYKTIKIRIYTSFRRYEWTIILLSSQNASRKIQKIMNEFFKPFSSFPIEHANNNSIVLTNKSELPKTKLYLFIFQNDYVPIQKSALFSKKFPNVIVNKKQLPVSYLVFSTIYDNLTFPNSIWIKNLTIWHLHNFCENYIYFQTHCCICLKHFKIITKL
ncbi:hypothetical protein CFOL_v3_21399 [Cephalotus follicularis]|uniref:Retropepsins domain-containing protein n=1 Tax=Cephalotus follicularis TaxID=3775 RepID=A0A1Q3CCV7_CEPFO|nr:hypothetical protein CFOL_v3_21399 [Cephalotus follicularis]